LSKEEELDELDVLPHNLYLTSNLIPSRLQTLTDILLQNYTLREMTDELDAFRSIPSLFNRPQISLSSVACTVCYSSRSAPQLPGHGSTLKRLSTMAASLLQIVGGRNSSSPFLGRDELQFFLETFARMIRWEN
jgi:hypothetical protein